jgi:putative MATE family efflux protein
MPKQPIEKQFFKFVLPSMLTMLLSGLYTIVDGIFVGYAVGDVGLAGMGIVWPVTALLMAVGMGIGVGGSVVMSTHRGAGENEKANQARANTIILLLIASVGITVFLLLLNPMILRALGAQGAVYDAAISYIHVIAVGGSMQILASGLIPIIRNSHQTVQAMLIMSVGLVANITLDALLTIVIPWGLRGAALATIIGQALTVVCSVICLWRQKEHKIRRADFVLDKKMMVRTIKIGASPFGLSLMPPLLTVFNNWQCLAYGGTLAVSAYAVINYFISSVLLLLEGIGEGMQPLISFCNGAKDFKAMVKIRNKGLFTILAFSTVFLLITIPARTMLAQLFSTSEETANIIYSALPILCIAFPMMGLGKLFTSYFYACGETKFSALLVYCDPIVFTPICLLVLPAIWQLKGIWLSLPSAQILTMLLLAILLVKHTRKYKRLEAV